MKKLLPQYESASFLRKLFLSLIAMVLASIILVAAFLLISYFHSANMLIDRFFQNLLMQSNYSITYMNDLAERLASSLSYNRQVINFLNMEENDSVQTVATHREVNSILLPLTYVDSVYLYNGRLDLMLDTKTGTQSTLDSFYDQSVSAQISGFDTMRGSTYVPFVHDSVYYGQTTSLYSYIIPDTDSDGNLLSAYVINIRMDVLMQSLQEINANNEYAKFVVAGSDAMLLSDSPFPDAESTEHLRQLVEQVIASGNAAGNLTVRISGQKFVMAYTNANSNGWYIFGMIPYFYISRDVISNTLMCVGFIAILCIICILVSRKLAANLNHPVEAVTQIARGEPLSDSQQKALSAQEFRYLASVLNKMQVEKEEYTKYIQRTKGLVRQEFLKDFFSGMVVYTPEQVQPRLETLNCGWILSSELRMCLFSIDNYADFAQTNNPKERWALRFAVINVSEELLRRNFPCEMVQVASDKFVAILNCSPSDGADKSTAALEGLLTQALSFVKEHLDFSLTAAYGPVFRDISHIPQMYENLEDLLLLRIRYGYGRVLNPHMAEDLNLDEFHVPSAVENTLVTSVAGASTQQAVAQFDIIAKDLFRYSYNEIMPYLTHLAYRLFNTAKESGSSAKAQAAEEFQKISAQLPQCQTEESFRKCFTDYLERLCAIISNVKNAPDTQSSVLIIQRVIKIIEANYPQKELCLSSIADELGLSAHYIGQVFRSSQNKSVSKYIMDLRLEKIAQELRETNRSFAEIMEDVGLDAEQKNYIYTCFKKRFGVTVKTYRQQFNSAPE